MKHNNFMAFHPIYTQVLISYDDQKMTNQIKEVEKRDQNEIKQISGC